MKNKSNFVITYNGVVDKELLTHIIGHRKTRFDTKYIKFGHIIQTYLRITTLPEEEQ